MDSCCVHRFVDCFSLELFIQRCPEHWCLCLCVDAGCNFSPWLCRGRAGGLYGAASLIFQDAACFLPVRCTIPVLISICSCWTTLGIGQSFRFRCSKMPTHWVCTRRLMVVSVCTSCVSFADVYCLHVSCGSLMSALCLGYTLLAFCFWNSVFYEQYLLCDEVYLIEFS